MHSNSFLFRTGEEYDDDEYDAPRISILPQQPVRATAARGRPTSSASAGSTTSASLLLPTAASLSLRSQQLPSNELLRLSAADEGYFTNTTGGSSSSSSRWNSGGELRTTPTALASASGSNSAPASKSSVAARGSTPSPSAAVVDPAVAAALAKELRSAPPVIAAPAMGYQRSRTFVRQYVDPMPDSDDDAEKPAASQGEPSALAAVAPALVPPDEGRRDVLVVAQERRDDENVKAAAAAARVATATDPHTDPVAPEQPAASAAPPPPAAVPATSPPRTHSDSAVVDASGTSPPRLPALSARAMLSPKSDDADDRQQQQQQQQHVPGRARVPASTLAEPHSSRWQLSASLPPAGASSLHKAPHRAAVPGAATSSPARAAAMPLRRSVATSPTPPPVVGAGQPDTTTPTLEARPGVAQSSALRSGEVALASFAPAMESEEPSTAQPHTLGASASSRQQAEALPAGAVATAPAEEEAAAAESVNADRPELASTQRPRDAAATPPPVAVSVASEAPQQQQQQQRSHGSVAPPPAAAAALAPSVSVSFLDSQGWQQPHRRSASASARPPPPADSPRTSSAILVAPPKAERAVVSPQRAAVPSQEAPLQRQQQQQVVQPASIVAPRTRSSSAMMRLESSADPRSISAPLQQPAAAAAPDTPRQRAEPLAIVAPRTRSSLALKRAASLERMNSARSTSRSNSRERLVAATPTEAAATSPTMGIVGPRTRSSSAMMRLDSSADPRRSTSAQPVQHAPPAAARYEVHQQEAVAIVPPRTRSSSAMLHRERSVSASPPQQAVVLGSPVGRAAREGPVVVGSATPQRVEPTIRPPRTRSSSAMGRPPGPTTTSAAPAAAAPVSPASPSPPPEETPAVPEKRTISVPRRESMAAVAATPKHQVVVPRVKATTVVTRDAAGREVVTVLSPPAADVRPAALNGGDSQQRASPQPSVVTPQRRQGSVVVSSAPPPPPAAVSSSSSTTPAAPSTVIVASVNTTGSPSRRTPSRSVRLSAVVVAPVARSASATCPAFAATTMPGRASPVVVAQPAVVPRGLPRSTSVISAASRMAPANASFQNSSFTAPPPPTATGRASSASLRSNSLSGIVGLPRQSTSLANGGSGGAPPSSQPSASVRWPVQQSLWHAEGADSLLRVLQPHPSAARQGRPVTPVMVFGAPVAAKRAAPGTLPRHVLVERNMSMSFGPVVDEIA